MRSISQPRYPWSFSSIAITAHSARVGAADANSSDGEARSRPNCESGRRWDLISANALAMAILTACLTPELLRAPVNVLRATLHHEGLAPRITSLAE